MKTRIIHLGVLATLIVLAVASTSATELISNGGFETVPFAPWATTNATRGWFNFNNAAGAHSGNRYEYIGKESDGTTTANNVEDILYQAVTIPSGTTSSTLTFWLKITSNDTSGTAHDTLAIEIRSTGNSLLQTLANYSNVDAPTTGSWTQKTLNFSGYANQTVRICFHGKTDASIETVFRIDDVSLQPTVLSQPDIVVLGTPTITPNPVTAGNSIAVAYTITNQGPANAGTSQTKIQVKNSSNVQVTAPTFSAPAVNAYSAVRVTNTVPLDGSLPSGTYTAYVILDNLNGLNQSNTNNDLTPGVSFTVNAVVLQPDILVQGTPTITPNPVTAGNSIAVAYTITNQGPANAGTSQTKVQIKNSSNVQVTAPTFSAPAVNAYSAVRVTNTVPLDGSLPSGTYTAYVILDNLNGLNQSNTNNDLTPGVSFTVNAVVLQPDILVQGTPTITPNPVMAGNSIAVAYTITNQGPANAGTSQTKVQIKNSSNVQVTAPTFSAPSVNAYSAVRVTNTVPLDSSLPLGAYTAYVILDNLSALNQSNTNNDLTAGVSFMVTNSTTTTTTNRALGLDVSHLRGTINWSLVKSDNKVFAFVKATEGTDFKDTNYVSNMQNAHANGLLVGAFHFALPLDNPGTNGAIAEAKYFVSNAQPYIVSGYLPPVLDIEDHPYPNEFPGDSCLIYDSHGNPVGVDLVCKLGQSTLSAWVRAWVQEVQKDTGLKPIIYTEPYYTRNMDTDLNAYPLWIAYYERPSDVNPQTDGAAPFGPWNYSWTFLEYSVTNTVSGITNPPVDVDVFNGDLTALTNTYGTTSVGGDGSAPVISNPKLTGSTFTLSVPTHTGTNYVLEYKNSMSDVNWIPIQTNSGNGAQMTLTNTGATGPSRFYRVRVQ